MTRTARHIVLRMTAELWLGWDARAVVPELPPSGPLERGDIER